MKRKEKENFRNMNLAELQGVLRDLEKKMFQLNFTRKTTPLANPLEIRNLRRKIAFIKTIINQKKATVGSKD